MWTGFVCAALLLLSCSGKSDGGNGSSLNLLVSMREYSLPSCVEVQHQWTGSESIGVGLKDGKIEEYTPLPADGATARCLVATKGKKEVSIFGRYPSDAPVTWDGKSVHYSIPTVQNGTIEPMACGVASGLPGSYDPAGLVLKPVYRVMPSVAELTGNKHIRVSENVLVESIMPGKGIRYTAVIRTDNKLHDGEAVFRISVFQGSREMASQAREFRIMTSKR